MERSALEHRTGFQEAGIWDSCEHHHFGRDPSELLRARQAMLRATEDAGSVPVDSVVLPGHIQVF